MFFLMRITVSEILQYICQIVSFIFTLYITQNLTLFLEHRIAWGVFKIIIESSICFAFV